jgi:hypothetical protein
MLVITHFLSPALLFVETAPWFLQWDLWVSVFTLLLAVGTIWLALETRGMRKGSDKAMAEMSSHAAASARAAEKSADATLALAEIGQRAWISIKSVYLLGDLAEQNLLAMRVTMLNSGNTPGLITHVGFHYYILGTGFRLVRRLELVGDLDAGNGCLCAEAGRRNAGFEGLGQ